MLTASLLIVLGIFTTGCTRERVIANPNKPHLLSRGQTLWLFIEHPENGMVEMRVRVSEGSLVIPPRVIPLLNE